MNKFFFEDKEYTTDSLGFLLNRGDWDRNFAEGMSRNLSILTGLTEMHWKVINFIRYTFLKVNYCPNIYRTCKELNLKLSELKQLFPTGYQRGACLLAGITYHDGYLSYHQEGIAYSRPQADAAKTYRIDSHGFLVVPEEWDENFAVLKAEEMKMPQLLTEKHFLILHYIRDYFGRKGEIPTIYETCENARIEIDEFGELFPDGYHRGAVKIAGLRLK